MGKYNIKIISRHEAILMNVKELEEDCMLISINSKGEKHHKFTNPKIKRFIYLDFDDIEPKHIERGCQGNVMTLYQASILKRFIDEFKEIKNIYVHCTAGISRSAAVGFILDRYLNKHDDLYLFEMGNYSPNRWVYRLMCRAFDFQFNNYEFKSKLNRSYKKSTEELKGYGDYGMGLNEIMGVGNNSISVNPFNSIDFSRTLSEKIAVNMLEHIAENNGRVNNE